MGECHHSSLVNRCRCCVKVPRNLRLLIAAGTCLSFGISGLLSNRQKFQFVGNHPGLSHGLTGVFCCWPELEVKSPFAQPEKTAEPIANPARATKCIFIVSSRVLVLVVGQTTCFGLSQAPGTSVSRGVRRNALVKASERHGKESFHLFGVKFAQITDRLD